MGTRAAVTANVQAMRLHPDPTTLVGATAGTDTGLTGSAISAIVNSRKHHSQCVSCDDVCSPQFPQITLSAGTLGILLNLSGLPDSVQAKAALLHPHLGSIEDLTIGADDHPAADFCHFHAAFSRTQTMARR